MKLKQLFVVLFVLALVLALPLTASAEEVASGTCGDNLTWVLDDAGTLTISGTGAMPDYGYGGSPWDGQDAIINIIVEDGVTSIGDYAFFGCDSLVSVTIGNSVTSIGFYAFYDCYSLTKVNMGNCTADISSSAFSGCTSLTGIYVNPGNTAYSNDDAGVLFNKDKTILVRCPTSLAGSYTIPDSVTSIGSYAFSYCDILVSVTIGNSVASIGDYAFYSCDSLVSVTIGDGVISIGNSVFSDCDGPSWVYYSGSQAQWDGISIGDGNGSLLDAELHLNGSRPDIASGICGDDLTWVLDGQLTLTISGTGAMDEYTADSYNCDSSWYDYRDCVLKVNIGGDVTSIGAYAFHDFDALTEITIPDSVIVIGINAFGECWALNKVVIGSGVEFVRNYAFNNCHSLVKVNLGNCTAEIAGNAFYGCTSLAGIYVNPGNTAYSNDDTGVLYNKDKTILVRCPTGLAGSYTIPDSVTSIGDYAFAYSDSLTKITIPDSVTSIGDYAFDYCDSLTEITIPDSVTSIGSGAFCYCYSLTEITIPDSVTSIDDHVFVYCTDLESITIPDSVTSIGDYAFAYSDSLTEITIPDSVTSIGGGAFYDCDGLKSITIPDSVQEIGSNVFEDCDNLKSVRLGCGLYRIPFRAFWGCDKLLEVIMPDSIGRLEVGTFYNCGNLFKICYGGTRDEWERINIWGYNENLKDILIHFNENSDHLCDTCGYVVGICRDPNRDHNCDRCGAVMNECYDDDRDYYCDICWKELPAEIIRLAGSHRWETALKVADEMKTNLDIEKFNAIIIASGNDFADALAGSYLSTVKNAPILLAWGKGGKYVTLDEANITYIKANLAENGTVYILGGKNAVPELYETGLAGYNVKRLGGANRFETNLLILEEAGIPFECEILVCTSTNFADSLSASATGLPILLVFNEYGKLYGKQPEFLSKRDDCSFTIIGGENAVSEKLAGAIEEYGGVERLAGANRFETSVLVAEEYFGNPRTAVLAYAWNYPDGLCGGSLAFSLKAPLILTMTKFEDAAVEYAKATGITSGLVLGGDGLISDDAVRSIFAMDAADEIIVK